MATLAQQSKWSQRAAMVQFHCGFHGYYTYFLLSTNRCDALMPPTLRSIRRVYMLRRLGAHDRSLGYVRCPNYPSFTLMLALASQPTRGAHEQIFQSHHAKFTRNAAGTVLFFPKN